MLAAGVMLAAGLATPLAAHPAHRHHATVIAPRIAPKVRPSPAVAAAPQPPEPSIDLSHAVPAQSISDLPPTAEQFRALKTELDKDRPAVASARARSDDLAREALALKQKLVATAARIEELERDKIALGAEIARLETQDKRIIQSFARDRVSVTRLLALLERLQHDMPPAIVIRPGDALGAVRSSMLIGASLPDIYGQAAALARRIEFLKATRAALIERRAQGLANAGALRQAHGELDRLLADKERQASAAAGVYGGLKARLDLIASRATDLKMLLAKVSQLRGQAAETSMVTVTAQKGAGAGLARLLVPVVGHIVTVPGSEAAHEPGLVFAAAPGAQVIAPADGKVLFAGPYHKSGQVLILEITTGYDLVLAGLGRVSVRPNDELLAGEPVGTMPESGPGAGPQAGDDAKQDSRLYFELRQNGHGLNPAQWLNLDPRKAKKT